MAYPATTSGFRLGKRSDHHPLPNLSSDATLSAVPSIAPIDSALAPSTVARKAGMSG